MVLLDFPIDPFDPDAVKILVREKFEDGGHVLVELLDGLPLYLVDAGPEIDELVADFLVVLLLDDLSLLGDRVEVRLELAELELQPVGLAVRLEHLAGAVIVGFDLLPEALRTLVDLLLQLRGGFYLLGMPVLELVESGRDIRLGDGRPAGPASQLRAKLNQLAGHRAALHLGAAVVLEDPLIVGVEHLLVKRDGALELTNVSAESLLLVAESLEMLANLLIGLLARSRSSAKSARDTPSRRCISLSNRSEVRVAFI